MKTPQRVVWSEGMFLAPQHFQAQDQFHEALLDARLDTLSSYPWGVSALELDGAALASGQLRVQRFAGTFPDGLFVGFDEADVEAPPPRAVADRFPASARSLPVYLAVRRERDGLSSYADDPNAPARYAIANRPTHDASRPGAMTDVPFGRPRSALLLGDEPREDHEVIQIAELVRTGSGQIAASEAYLPPLLKLSAAPRLLATVRDLVVRLVAKHRELSEGRRHRDGVGGEVTGPELSRMLQLFALGGAIPVLQDAADTGDVAPSLVYRVLSRLAGQLSTFTAEADVASLPRYVHTDLRTTFEPLVGRLQAFLGGMAAERFVRVPLEVRGALQVARMADEKLLRGAQLYLTVKSEIPEQQVAEQLPRLCKIASLGDIQGLVQAAAPGLPLQLLNRPPPEIPVRAGVVCFGITQSDRLWKNVTTDRTLAFYLPPPFDPSRTRVDLLAVTTGG